MKIHKRMKHGNINDIDDGNQDEGLQGATDPKNETLPVIEMGKCNLCN